MDIKGETKDQVVAKMEKLLELKEMDRLLCLLDIFLNHLARTKEY